MSKLLKKFKRSVAIVLSITTFAWALGPVALLMPTQALAAEAKAGDLIKMNGLSSVYYLGADSKRYVFPNETTYNSWYSGFSSVKTISQSELESYSLGSNVTVRPGTKLVKITTNPKVYAVEASGVLKGIPDEATASTLYGANWAKKVVDVPDAFFTNYTISDEQVSATAYPKGTLIKYAGSADIYVVDSATTARKIASTEAMTANRYKDADVVTAPATITYTSGTAITAAESTLVDLSKTGVTAGTGAVVVAGTIAVSLSSATPASATIIAGQAIANLASFDFKAGDADAKITSIKVKRTGVSADTTLANVYLYDGATRLTDNASVSSTYITWDNSAGIFTIPKNTTRTISVKSDIAASTSGQTVGVGIVAATDITSDATVSGTFPVNGNLMSVASATNFASVAFSDSTVILPAENTSVTAQDNFELWKDPNIDIADGPVDFYSVRFRQIGSVLADDVKNFELYIDGVKQGATIEKVDSNGYIEFDLGAKPLQLDKSTFEMKVLADLIDGSTRTVSLSLRQAADIVIKDSEYNANIRATVSGSTSFSAVSSGTQTIAGGTLTVTKTTTSASGDVVDGASGVSLGKFEFKAAGESIKVETLKISADCTETDDGSIGRLRNGKILANGIQIGSTADIYDSAEGSTTYTDYTLGSSLTINPGTPVNVEIIADIYDNDGTDHITANDTIVIRIEVATNNAQKLDSLSYFNGPATAVTGNTLTVKTGSLSLASATSYANHSVVAPKTAYKLGEWNLTAGTTEAVNLTSFLVIFTGGTMYVPTKVSDAYLVYGTDTTSIKSTVASTSNTWTLSKSLAYGTTMNVALYGTITSGSVGTIIPTLTVNATTASSGTSANSSATVAQTTTWTTGSITTAATETPLPQIVYGGQTVTAATYEINPTNDTYTLEEVCVKVASGSQAAINRVYLYDGDTLLNTGGTPMNTYFATTTGLSLVMTPNVTKTLTVKLGLNSVGTGMADPGLDAAVTLDTIAVRNSNGTKSYVSDDRAGNEVYVYKAYPVVTSIALSDTEREVDNDVNQAIYKFKIAPSSSSTIAVKQMKFSLSWSDTTNLAALELGTFKFFRGNTDITTSVEITAANGTSAKSGGTTLKETDAVVVVGFITSEEPVSAETTYTIKATPANFDSGTTSSDSVTITMVGDTSAHSGTKKYAVATITGSKIWKLATAAAGTGATAYNFIWSDKSATPHVAASGTSSADWANGYLVNYFDLDSTKMKK